MNKDKVIELVSETLVRAGSTFSADKKEAYEQAIARESNPTAKWVLQTVLENACVAEKNRSPLCDDTGIPHVLLEVGPNASISGELLDAINLGVAEGLRRLPGRPMAVVGDEMERISQSKGLFEDPGELAPAPVAIRQSTENRLRLHVIMFGGGPAIRGRSYRVFHKHSVEVVREEIIQWAIEACGQLGCTPCTVAIGIGRSHYEAASLMLEAQVYGRYSEQSSFEHEITEAVNKSNVGPLGLHGDTTVLATFASIGPQRASGVRIVCLRPCCCFEPRIASVDLV